MNIPVRAAVTEVSIPAVPSAAIEIGSEAYRGTYEFTPTGETQTVAVQNKVMLQDITINPIPNNYGKVSWDGATIMIE